MEGGQRIGHRGEFGTSALHSSLRVGRSRAKGLSRFQSQIARTWHGLPGQTNVKLAKTIGSDWIKREKILTLHSAKKKKTQTQKSYSETSL